VAEATKFIAYMQNMVAPLQVSKSSVIQAEYYFHLFCGRSCWNSQTGNGFFAGMVEVHEEVL
jgi:hypothetical protein